MKNILLITSFLFTTTAYAATAGIPISVPSAGSPNVMLESTTTNGRYGATTSPNVGSINATTSAFTSRFSGSLQVDTNLNLSNSSGWNSATNVLTITGTLGRQCSVGGGIQALSCSDGTRLANLSDGISAGYFTNDVGGAVRLATNNFGLDVSVLDARVQTNLDVQGTVYASSTRTDAITKSERFGTLATSTPWGLLTIVGTTTNALAVPTPLILVSTSTLTSTSTAFVIDANGRVGIGTSSPQAPFAVKGNSYFQGLVGIGVFDASQVNTNGKLTVAGVSSQDIIASTTDNTTLSDAIFNAYAPGSRVFLGAHGTNQVAIRYALTLGGWGEIGLFNDSANGLVIGTNPAVPLVLGTNNQERLRILSTGNIGIGTTSPKALLSLSSYANTTGNQFLVSTSTLTATSTAFIIDPNGKVGIGTTSPGQDFSVAGSLLVTGNGSASSTFQGGVQTAGLSTSNGLTLTGGSLLLSTLTVNGGVLLANTTGSVTNGTNFQFGSIASTLSVSNFYNAGIEGIGTSTSIARLAVANPAASANPVFLVSTTTAGFSTSTVFMIDSNGKVGIGTTSPSSALSVQGGLVVSGNGKPSTITSDFQIFSTTRVFSSLFSATTTPDGKIHAAIGLGTTSTFSATSSNVDAGLRPGITVGDKLYEAGKSLKCDMPYAQPSYESFTGTGATNVSFSIEHVYVFSTTSICGFTFANSGATNAGVGLAWSDNNGTGIAINPTTTPLMPSLRLQAGNLAGNAVAGAFSSLQTLTAVGDARANPMIECWLRGTGSGTTTTNTICGFQAGASTTAYDTRLETAPTQGGSFFVSGTNTPSTWKAVNSTGSYGNSTMTFFDTGVQVSSPLSTGRANDEAPFQKLRIEIFGSSTTFIIDGIPLVTLSTTSPSGGLFAKVGTSNLTGGTFGKAAVDLNLLRVWTDK